MTTTSKNPYGAKLAACTGAFAVAGLIAGCSFDRSGINGDNGTTDSFDASATLDGAVLDASVIDVVPPDAPCRSWETAHFDPCTDAPPTNNALELLTGEHVYNTDMQRFTMGGPAAALPVKELTQADTSKVLLMAVTNMRIGQNATLRVVGMRPLLVAATGTIEIEGRVSVASSRMRGPGAGANSSACLAAASGENDAGGAGGGGGGGFQGKGGNGGPGDMNNSAGGDGPSNGGAGGAKVATPPMTIRGGCSGAAGGLGSGNNAGQGGAGGGAIQLSAQMDITITGTIEAGGSGGQGAPVGSGGGGGGGSGGYIGLDAPRVAVQGGTLAANGGGGGEGGLIDVDSPDGGDGAASATAALGANMYAQAGNGANGSAGTTLDGAEATNHVEGGGGGGGGGAGFIIVRTANYQPTGAPVLSPPITEIRVTQ